jgi:cruciform cutting endonuclease 1
VSTCGDVPGARHSCTRLIESSNIPLLFSRKSLFIYSRLGCQYDSLIATISTSSSFLAKHGKLHNVDTWDNLDMTTHGFSQVLKWLDNLKAAQLQRLAISLGTSYSGTKEAIKHSIMQSLPTEQPLIVPNRRQRAQSAPLSLISIDMGIRNLAYAHLQTAVDLRQEEKNHFTDYQRPRLCAWEKIIIAPSAATEKQPRDPDRRKRPRSKPESFAPSVYATHAVGLITRIIDTHHPTHILIERQRFRSGGSPIVQDWSIRVGVFEGMLYAVLKTLGEKCGTNIEVEGVEPVKVNRFWLDKAGKGDAPAAGDSSVPKGKAMKQFKIELVREALEGSSKAGTGDTGFDVDVEATPMVNAYLSKLAKDNRSLVYSSTASESDSDKSLAGLRKLDDLADSLLQGMAWIEWQNNRARVAASGDEEAPPFV